MFLNFFVYFKNNDTQSVLYFDQTNNWPIGQQMPSNKSDFINFVKEILYTINPNSLKLNGMIDPLILVHSKWF